MNIAHIDITTKKNTAVKTLWNVWQERPYPRICDGHSLRWTNTGGILPQYGREAEGLGCKYRAKLLRADFDPANATKDRCDEAGFNGNPSLEYRGRQIGEVNAEINFGPVYKEGWSVWFKGGYQNALTDGERELLNTQAAEALMEYVKANAATLKAEAVEAIKTSAENHVREARARLIEMEAEMAAAIAKL